MCRVEILEVLDLPDLKIVKSSDTRWLAHECCVKAVKPSYISIVLSLQNIYETSHEPETLGLIKLFLVTPQWQQCYLTTFFLKWQCSDVTTIEELTICCRWVERGVPEEYSIEILPLKKVNAEGIYSASCLTDQAPGPLPYF